MRPPQIVIAAACLLSLIGGPSAGELTGAARLNAIHNGGPAKKQPTPIISFNPPSPNTADDALDGTIAAQIIVRMSDGSSFTGSLGFGSPYYNDGNIFAISGSNLIVNPGGPGIPGGTSTQNVTVTATQ